MKRIVIALAICVICLASTANADFPRRRSCGNVVVHNACHEVAVVHEAVAVVPTVAAVVPTTTFVFQYLGGYPMQGAPAFQSPAQPFAAPQQSPPQSPPQVAGLSDQQLDKIANLVVAKLQGSTVAQNTMIQSPPVVADQAHSIVSEIQNKCASCHQVGIKTSGGLAIFDAAGQLNPLKNGTAYADHGRLWQRAQSREMPPSAMSDQSKALSAEAIAFLRQASGQ